MNKEELLDKIDEWHESSDNPLHEYLGWSFEKYRRWVEDPEKFYGDRLEIDSALVKKTCFASPSQWEAKTVDGDFVYIRYRWGTLRVDLADSKDDWWDDEYETCFKGKIGDGLDGLIGWPKVKEAAGLVEV